GDLAVVLVPPPALQAVGATPIRLAQNRPALGVGSGADFRDTVFDDQSLTPVAFGSAPFTGAFRPEDVLNQAALIGANPSGTWTLRITD
ncbi:hypothetical protein OFC17_32100, partial [Escherichia coli]|nr:hypothetical protein [Escherichia coli]